MADEALSVEEECMETHFIMLPPLLLLLVMPAVVQTQFTLTTNKRGDDGHGIQPLRQFDQ